MRSESRIVDVAVFLRHKEVPHYALSGAQAARLARSLPGSRLTVCDDSAAFAQALTTAEVAVGWRFRQEWIDAAPRLRWLATPSAGRDFFAVTPRPGTIVTYGSFHGKFIAETVTAMALAESRGLLAAARLQALGNHWAPRVLSTPMRLVRGSRALILGFGNIGERIGFHLKQVGINVSGVRRNPAAMHRPSWMDANDAIHGIADLDTLLPGATHVVLVLPSDTGTDNMLDARRLALLSPDAVIYNVGRGNAIDEAALATALQNGRLRAACLDVFAREPLPADSPLLRAPNLHVLPHISAAAPEYFESYITELAGLWQEYMRRR